MTRYSTLSEEVQSFIEAHDWGKEHDIPPEEREEAKKAKTIVKFIVDDIIASRESLLENRLAVIEKFVLAEPELVKYFLDERFTQDVIDAVSGYVSRTMELSRLEGSRTPSKTTNSYLREAVRTYIFGFPQASVALCRAALEQALKESLGYQSSGTFLPMNQLLDEAENDPEVAPVIDKYVRQMARKIANAADLVLHEKPTDLATAYEVLLLLRSVLQHIYAE